MSGCNHLPVVDNCRATEIFFFILQTETENLQLLFLIPQIEGDSEVIISKWNRINRLIGSPRTFHPLSIIDFLQRFVAAALEVCLSEVGVGSSS